MLYTENTHKSGGDRIRTCDLEVMSLASYRAAPPRDMKFSSEDELLLSSDAKGSF